MFVAKVSVNPPPAPIAAPWVMPSIVTWTTSPGAGNVVPFPITPARVIEAAPTVIACDAVNPLNVDTVEPVPMPDNGALCV